MSTTSDQRTRMRGFVFDAYGTPEDLRLTEIDRPAVKDGEVLVRIRAAGANPADWRMLRGDFLLVRLMLGLRRPRKTGILGRDLAGVVEAVGAGVTRLSPGDEVYAELDYGGFAEYVSCPADMVAPKPTNLTFEQAAAVPLAALTALQALRDKGRIASGQQVLINGASGGIGTFAVQLAKAFGAEVTGVCGTGNVDLVRSIGADRVIDYTREDFTRGERRYDLILDNVGNRGVSEFRRVLTRKGTFVAAGGGGGRWLGPAAILLRAILLSPFVSQTLTTVAMRHSAEDLRFLAGLIEAGKVTPVIDSTYPLSRVPEAIRYQERGHTRGKVVITV